ncbi:MAG: hypothetical protein H8E30_19820 [Alphaproteobacteria bacterium]|nr:hypothetical protein [Alphaproteobacteria bacterium]
MDDPVTHAIRVLNEALARDADAITRLVNMRVDCNERLAGHPTIKVSVYEDGLCRLGVLGLINGAIGDSPSGSIGARGTMDKKTGRFTQIREFIDLRKDTFDRLA